MRAIINGTNVAFAGVSPLAQFGEAGPLRARLVLNVEPDMLDFQFLIPVGPGRFAASAITTVDGVARIWPLTQYPYNRFVPLDTGLQALTTSGPFEFFRFRVQI